MRACSWWRRVKMKREKATDALRRMRAGRAAAEHRQNTSGTPAEPTSPSHALRSICASDHRRARAPDILPSR